MAAVFTLLFKKDNDISEFESDLGNMKEADVDIMPKNKGNLSFSYMYPVPSSSTSFKVKSQK